MRTPQGQRECSRFSRAGCAARFGTAQFGSPYHSEIGSEDSCERALYRKNHEAKLKHGSRKRVREISVDEERKSENITITIAEVSARAWRR
jgi:hypothetical protein